MTAPRPDWQRLHPLTPLLRGGRGLVVLLTVLGTQGLRSTSPLVLLGLLALGAVLAGLVGVVTWRTTRFRVAGGELQVDSGLLVRRSRRVPLARVQSVDVVRPLVGRLLGVAELRLEVVGGREPEAPLRYLADGEARRLQAVLLAGGDPTAGGPAPEQVLVQVPTSALVVSVLLGPPLVVGGLALVVVLGVLAVAPDGVVPLLAVVGPLLLAVGGAAGRRVVAEYGATVAESADGLRLRSGLLDTRTSTVPPGRVQTVRVLEPLLWRRRGWVRVEVDVAGYGATRGEEQAATSALLPVAPRALADAVVARVLGGELPVLGAPAPPAARWRAPLSARNLRVGVDALHVVTTSGVLVQTTDVVPLAKVQSVRRVQGPWQRRLGLVSVVADSAGRRLEGATASHRGTAEADALVEELSARARAARRLSP